MLTSRGRQDINLFVTDLDNTIWDWSRSWFYQINALLSGVTKISGIDPELLLEETRSVHQRHGTTEYSWLLEELPSVQAYAAGRSVKEVFNEAIHAQNSARVTSLRLYPEVLSTLQLIKAHGVPIVAYTESQVYWTEWRIRKTKLDGIIDVIYSQPDHDHPAGLSLENQRFFNNEEYELKFTKHRSVPRGIAKPNTIILKGILEDFHTPANRAVYVGDSKSKDVAMAQLLGTHDVWAEYGSLTDKPEYEMLRKLSHWSDKEILAERTRIPHQDVTPSYTLKHGFSELLELFYFKGGG